MPIKRRKGVLARSCVRLASMSPDFRKPRPLALKQLFLLV
jgi:hypothetical protein